MARAIDTFCRMPVLILAPEHVAEVVHLQGGEHLFHALAQRSSVMP